MENSHLLEYIGKTKTNNLIESINAEYFENFTKKYPNYYQAEISKASSLVTVTKENEIKKIGMSCLNDLLNDNFGKTMGGIMYSASAETNLIDFNGNTRNLLFRGSGLGGSTIFNTVSAPLNPTGTLIQIGSGNTPATRQDFNIETPFSSAPENVRRATGNGGWNSPLGQVSAPMSPFGTGGSGTINETCFFWQLIIRTNVDIIFMMSRDNITPAVSFINGETINVDYTFGFS